MSLVVAIGAGVGVAAVVLLVGLVAANPSRAVSTRFRKMVSPPPEKQYLPKDPVAGEKRPDLLPTVTAVLSGRRLTEKLYAELTAAGLPLRPSEFVGIAAGSVILSQFLAVLLAKNLFGYLLFAVIGVGLPYGVLRSLQRKRRAAFDAQIVDALMLIASSLRSGFSFLRSMQMVASEMPPPIAQEFQCVINEMNVGRPMEDALRSAVARVKSYDFDLVVTAVLIQFQVGGNLAEILEIIASTIRERVRIHGEIKALTAEGKLSGIILVLLPIGMGAILVALNPDYMRPLLFEKVGQYMIAAAVLLQIIGGLVIRKLLAMEV